MYQSKYQLFVQPLFGVIAIAVSTVVIYCNSLCYFHSRYYTIYSLIIWKYCLYLQSYNDIDTDIHNFIMCIYFFCRCLHKSGGCLMFEPSKCAQVISACIRLHNLCITNNIPLLVPTVNDADDVQAVIQIPAPQSAIIKRQAIVHLFR